MNGLEKFCSVPDHTLASLVEPRNKKIEKKKEQRVAFSGRGGSFEVSFSITYRSLLSEANGFRLEKQVKTGFFQVGS